MKSNKMHIGKVDGVEVVQSCNVTYVRERIAIYAPRHDCRIESYDGDHHIRTTYLRGAE